MASSSHSVTSPDVMSARKQATSSNIHKQSDSLPQLVLFGGSAPGATPDKQLHGGKGASLLKMTSMGLGVPPGFTLTTEAFRAYDCDNDAFRKNMQSEMEQAIQHIENTVGRSFGDASDPLLVSVRSGAAVSMPGMMDTILNLGLNSENVKEVAARQGDLFAWSSYLRLISQFTGLVLVPEKDDEVLHPLLDMGEQPKSADEAQQRCRDALAHLEKRGTPFPQDVWQQLWAATETVFCSWNNERAYVYRKLQGIEHNLGTACNIMAMVFGNRNDNSGTGVCFSRDPSSGEPGISGEYLAKGQGEDVVAGIRTPSPISAMSPGAESMETRHPELYKQLCDTLTTLEDQFKDVVDVEFTVEDGNLYFLQCRAAKRSAEAALKIAADFVVEGRISEPEMLGRIAPQQIASLLRPRFRPDSLQEAETSQRHLANGLPAGPGAACGRICFDYEDAPNDNWILVRRETSPEDVKAMSMAAGVLTIRGGMSSHAALVARQLGIVAVVGCESATLNETAKTLTFGDTVLKEGDFVSIDGSTGAVYSGQIATVPPSLQNPHAQRVLQIADDTRKLCIRGNCDTPEQASKAREFGAEGIGLCRTEHMFFGEERLPLVQQLILSKSETERKAALDKLEHLQEDDFYGILLAMDGCPVTVRTIDPPLHEFLPKGNVEIAALAVQLKIDIHELETRIGEMHESNPMLGFRGCRLGVVYPDIPVMQVRALTAAAARLRKEGKNPLPEIMIPLTSTAKELQEHRGTLANEIQTVQDEMEINFDLPIGTMIEVPRAALVAGEIAQFADFISFGTNDLTQLTFGLSRDDASSFLPHYLENDIYEHDPFMTVDTAGVGQLIRIAVESARQTKPDIKVGICGEHGGDPDSIHFFAGLDFSYVSCSPYRVPVARLASAQVE